jgi:S-formylglutathione hydrolase FrmB
MAVCEVHGGVQVALWKQTSFTVILPEKGDGPFPVLYLLHGLSGDHTVWVRRTSIERYAQDLPLIIVMPNSARGWYTDSQTCPTAAFETAIVRDLIAYVDRVFHTVPGRAGRAIAGLSMGGYGALKLAFKHPHLFCAAGCHSGALILDELRSIGPEWAREFELIFGPQAAGGPEDVLTLAERLDPSEAPAVWMDIGLEDGFLEMNRRVHAHFQSIGLAHEYHEWSGGHAWDYWDRSIQQLLPWLCSVLGVTPVPQTI